MLGSANIKVRPLKLALMVDPNNASQVREAIRLACSLWGGMYFPIIPVHKRMPASWRIGALKAPLAVDVVQGFLVGFDPDLLVQFGKELPNYIIDSKLKVIKPEDFWRLHRGRNNCDPAYGIGVLDLLFNIFQEHFKFKAKFPAKVILPKIPKAFGLFWSSVFGEYPLHIAKAVEKEFSEALDVLMPEARADKFFELTADDVLFPRRITKWATHVQGGNNFRGHASIFYMDAGKIEDVIDFWNLRASGRPVLPLPKQFLKEKSFKNAVVEFIDEHRRPWGNGNNSFEVATLVRSRHSTMGEMEAFAKALRPDVGEGAQDLASQQISLQHWYPRLWDEWARGKDGGVADVYGKDEEAIDITGAQDLLIRIKPLIPSFARENWLRSDGVCANEFDLRIFGADEHLAEVYPKVEGNHLLQEISGSCQCFWRVASRASRSCQSCPQLVWRVAQSTRVGRGLFCLA
jgi:hypothetical protein